MAAALGSAGAVFAADSRFRQEKISGLSSFDVGECGNPELADLDGDGDLDLISGSYRGGLHYFANVASAGSAAAVFVERPGSASPFAAIATADFASPELADLDGDGDLDLALGDDNGLLRYFENTGSAARPVFLERSAASNPFAGIDVGEASSPDLADLDGDGDRDLLVGDEAGTFRYFANTGSPSAPAFLETGGNPFGGFDVGRYAAPQLFDADADGDLDLVAGSLEGWVYYFVNTGSAATPAFVQATGAHPFVVVPGSPESFFSNVALADLDGDGLRDLVVGESRGSFRHYRNTGSASAPAFVLAGADVSPLAGADLLRDTSVALADLDGDGDLDAVAGEESRLRYFRNTGTARHPAFEELTGSANPIMVGPIGASLSPAFSDLDDDGDFDLVVASYGGTFKLLKNTGSSTAPAFVTAPTSADPFANLFVSWGNIHPVLADMDGDGDDDFAVANISVTYYKNVGDAAFPDFVMRTGSANPFNAIGFSWGGSPALVDYDRDGDLDLVAGQDSGTFRFYLNSGSTVAPAFTEITGNANPFFGLDIGSGSVPAVHDLEGDGDLDLLAAESSGWLVYYADFVGLFVDGFESGDTGNWSQTVP